MKVYWKVLTENRLSCLMKDKDAIIYYPQGTWIKPRVRKSHIFIFDSEERAKSFMSFPEAQIVPCHAKGVTYNSMCRLSAPCRVRIKKLRVFWKDWNEHHRKHLFVGNYIDMKTMNVPFGTLWATAIKCLK